MTQPTVALSPSTQPANVGNYADHGTNEQEVNYDIAARLKKILEAHGVRVVMVTAGKGNSAGGYSQNVAWENAHGPFAAYVALHTDAGGATGTTAFYYSGSAAGKRLAQAIYDEIAPISPDPDHGVRAGDGYYEINGTRSVATIIEAAAHDRAHTAKWIVENRQPLAEAYARGILTYLGIKYHGPAPNPTPTGDDDMPSVAEIWDARIKRDGKRKPVIQELADIYTEVRKFWQTPVHRGTKRIPAIQELADAKTNTIEILAEVKALTAAVQTLATSHGVDPVRVEAILRDAVADALDGLTVSGTIEMGADS